MGSSEYVLSSTGRAVATCWKKLCGHKSPSWLCTWKVAWDDHVQVGYTCTSKRSTIYRRNYCARTGHERRAHSRCTWRIGGKTKKARAPCVIGLYQCMHLISNGAVASASRLGRALAPTATSRLALSFRAGKKTSQLKNLKHVTGFTAVSYTYRI